MSSTSKTLGLLSYFSVTRPEIGLSQLCRLAGRDKATTHRHLQALEGAGFVEQNPTTKAYRLGPALLHLAQTREVTVPRKSGAEHALAVLAQETGETCHVTVLSGTSVFSLMYLESSRHSTRVTIDLQTFPLHATASGLCALGFGPSDLFDVATANMTPCTPDTLTNAGALAQAVDHVRATGFAKSMRSFETEVCGIAAPIFDQTGLFAGSVAVASVATRFTPDLEARICHHLTDASREITRNWGGTLPDSLLDSWARSAPPPRILEQA